MWVGARIEYVSDCTNCSFFFFKQKTAYEMRISDGSSDVCSSDLIALRGDGCGHRSRVRAEQPAREGGSGNLREWCGRALRANPVPLIAVAGERRPGPPFPMRTNIMPAHAGTMPEIRLRSRP